MCEYSPDCDKATDPLAKTLSEHPREDIAVVLVYCPKRYHTLAAVYDEPALGGLVLVTPHMKARRGSLFVVADGQDPDETMHWHPGLEPLADMDLSAGRYGRCRCGTWHYKPARVMEEVDRVRSGTWRGIDPETFVRFRNDDTGAVGQQPRTFVEKHVLPKGNYSIIGRAPRSDRLRRPYVLSSYVKMADAPKR